MTYPTVTKEEPTPMKKPEVKKAEDASAAEAVDNAGEVVGGDKDRVNVNVIVTVFGVTVFGWRRKPR